MRKSVLDKQFPVLLVGLGSSGLAAARLLCREGFRVVACDRRPAAELADVPAELKRIGVEKLIPGEHDPDFFHSFKQLVISPGVPLAQPALQAARRGGAMIIGELELAASRVEFPLLAVTGTNGKSTVVSALGEVMQAAGYKTFVGGNLGRPASEMLDDDYQVGVLELSSFQLEAVVEFRPRVAVILNLTPDHQDRYDSQTDYLRAKAAISARQGRADSLILNQDDPALREMIEQGRQAWDSGVEAPRLLTFSLEKMPEWGAAWLADEICWRLPAADGRPAKGRLPALSPKIPGPHNRANLLAALLAAGSLGVDFQTAASALNEFSGLAHRLEAVGRIAGVDYYNDSKATNLDAVIKAVNSFSRPLVLLLGGYDKGADFAALKPFLPPDLRALVAFGAAAPTIADRLEVSDRVSDLTAAFRRARELARPGDVVLLAPGCASFDEFSNFGQRGDFFRGLVAGAQE